MPTCNSSVIYWLCQPTYCALLILLELADICESSELPLSFPSGSFSLAYFPSLSILFFRSFFPFIYCLVFFSFLSPFHPAHFFRFFSTFAIDTFFPAFLPLFVNPFLSTYLFFDFSFFSPPPFHVSILYLVFSFVYFHFQNSILDKFLFPIFGSSNFLVFMFLAIHYLHLSYNAYHSFPVSFLDYFLSPLFFLLISLLFSICISSFMLTFLSFLYYFFTNFV
jgi:hypothetical protein